MGFGFNKGPLNLNKNCIKNNQFWKLLSLKTVLIMEFWWNVFEMMLIDYAHLKRTHNLKIVEFENLKNLKSIE